MKREVTARDIVLKRKPVRSFAELAEMYGTSEAELRDTAEVLRKEGYGVETNGDQLRRNINMEVGETDLSAKFKRRSVFGLVSDTHIGNKHARMDALDAFYEAAKAEGIKEIFNLGDVTDGVDVFKGQLSEQETYGQEDQIEQVIQQYPHEKGVTTHFITGNHDLREFEGGGCDPGTAISKARPDMKYLGQLDQKIKLTEGGVNMEIIHPAGGPAYAISYRLQKALSGRDPDDIPAIYAQGHFHQAFYGHYKGTEALSVPSFKEDGLWERRFGFTSVVGGWMVEMETNADGTKIDRFKPELVNYKKR